MEEKTDINSLFFPGAIEGDRVLFNDKWYVYTNGTWVEESSIIEN